MSSGLLLKALMAEAEFQHAFTITPGTPLPMPARAIRCGQAGSLSVTMAGGETATINFLAGETRQLLVSAVTSASGITMIEGMA